MRSRFDVSRLQIVWQVVHDRLSSGQPVGRVRVGPLSANEREALADLLGLDRMPAPTTTLSIARLEAVVQEIDGRDLRSLVIDVIGPLDNRKERQAQLVADRAGLWEWLAGHHVVTAEPVLNDWVTHVRKAGVVDGSASATKAVLQQVLDVLQALPAEGASRPVFADRVLGDPHSLDDGRRLTTLVLRALACLLGEEFAEEAESRRSVWERMGVETDALSSTVLVAGVGPSSRGATEQVLTVCTEAGEAAVLTLAQVRSAAGSWRWAGSDVWVVENPSVMAAALASFGTACPPLVCVSGWPSAAGILLLRVMGGAGARIRYHGDLDGDGLRIAAHLVAKVGALPWRMSASEYRIALDRRPLGPPAGRVSDVPWDAELAPAMRASDLAVTEESVLDQLLLDLGSSGLAMSLR